MIRDLILDLDLDCVVDRILIWCYLTLIPAPDLRRALLVLFRLSRTQETFRVRFYELLITHESGTTEDW